MSRTERNLRRWGLWPIFGRLALVYYAWARREINPLHPDAPKVGRRYAALRAEFQETTYGAP